LPLFGLGLHIAQAEQRLRTTHQWSLRITGVDPRHLLYGRYVDYRLALPAQASCSSAAIDCCLCLRSNGETTPPDIRTTSCEAVAVSMHHAAGSKGGPRSCDAYLRGTEVSRLRHFYLSEDDAPEAERRLRLTGATNSAIVRLDIDEQGYATPRLLVIDGEEFGGH
jgi:hypothetical protein